ncbi:MAG: FtsX-like permease family protein [Anaerolineae bacterium]|nr:FtsX-like permease family protein [Anaerolineae bacterium]
MRAVWLKVKADVLARPVVSLMTLLTVISATTLLTLALATLLNLSAPYDRSFAALNGAHLWLYFDRSKMRARDVEKIAALPGVETITGLQYSVTARVRMRDSRAWLSIRCTETPPPAVNRLLVQEGRYLEARAEEVLATRDLADLYGLAVGDIIAVTAANQKDAALPVIGLAYNPIWDTYRNTQPPYLYVNEPTFRMLFPDDTTWEWSLGVRLRDPEAVDVIVNQIKERLNPDALVEHTDWRNVKESANFAAQLNFMLLGTFSFFAILATVLVIVSSISAFVLSQFRQIGILKSVGFTRAQILLLYVGQYVVLTFVGCPVGILLGIWLSPLPLRNVASSLSTTFSPPLNPWIVASVAVLIPLIVILSTLRSAWRGSRVNIVRALATGAEAPARKTFWGVRLAAWLRLPMPIVLGLGDVFAKPFRSLLTGLNLTLGVIGIVFSLVLNETLEAYKANPHLLGIAYDATVTRNRTGDPQTRHLLESAPGVAAFYGEMRLDAETMDGRTFQIRAVDGALDAFPFNILEGRLLQPGTDEAIAGQGLLDWLGLQVGDEITLTVNSRDSHPVTWHIVGSYTEPANAGQMLLANFSSVARLTSGSRPQVYYLKLTSDVDTARLKRYLEPREDADLSLTLAGQAVPAVVIYLQLALFILSAILIGIALVNVFNTTLLAVQEKLRIIGILKTLGLTPAQVLQMVNTSAGFLGALATLAGLPLGWILTKALLGMLAQMYGFGRVQVTLKFSYFLLLPLVMIGASIMGSFLPARRASRIPAVNILRCE